MTTTMLFLVYCITSSSSKNAKIKGTKMLKLLTAKIKVVTEVSCITIHNLPLTRVAAVIVVVLSIRVEKLMNLKCNRILRLRT